MCNNRSRIIDIWDLSINYYSKSLSCMEYTSVSFWSDKRDATRDFAFGLSRASYCKQREAKRTNSVPSSFEKWPSQAESINIKKFLPRIKSSACKRTKVNAVNIIFLFFIEFGTSMNHLIYTRHGLREH